MLTWYTSQDWILKRQLTPRKFPCSDQCRSLEGASPISVALRSRPTVGFFGFLEPRCRFGLLMSCPCIKIALLGLAYEFSQAERLQHMAASGLSQRMTQFGISQENAKCFGHLL